MSESKILVQFQLELWRQSQFIMKGELIWVFPIGLFATINLWHWATQYIEFVFADMLVQCALKDLIDLFREYTFAETLFNDTHWHLTHAETWHLGCFAVFFKRILYVVGVVILVQYDAEFSIQRVDLVLRNIHRM